MTAEKETEAKAKKKSLNEKIEELDTKVDWFYSEHFKLEEAVKKYKEALEIAKDVEKDLIELKNEIEVLDANFSQ